MTLDSMSRLAAANPVSVPPTVEAAERLRRLIEDGSHGPEQEAHGDMDAPRRSRRWLRGHVLVGVSTAAAASAVAVLLIADSAGPGVNVAAAAYAATSPVGLVEAVFQTRVLRGRQAGGALRQQEWNDAPAGLRRELTTTTGPYGDTHETHALELASAPGRLESWSSGPEADVVTRLRVPRTPKVRLAFGGITLDGVEGIELYRRVYREGLIRLVGHERRDGRSLWKLETPAHRVDPIGGALPHTGLVVLVDPKTFLPVSVRQIDLALPGHPTVVESDLLSYRHLSVRGSGRLFDIAAHHPRARLVVSDANPQVQLKALRRRR